MCAGYVLVVTLQNYSHSRTLTWAHAQHWLRSSAEVSLALSLTVCVLVRAKGKDSWAVARPFAEGVALCGHVAYFASSLALASSSWQVPHKELRTRRAMCLVSLCAAAAAACWLDAPALWPSVSVFGVLFLCVLRVGAVSGAAFKAATLLVIMLALWNRGYYVMRIVDPENLYA